MRYPLTILLVLALAAGAADLAHAASTAPLPLGTDGHGVRLVQRGTPAHLVVLLSPKRYRVVAGKELTMVCAPVPEVTLGGQVVVRPRGDFRRVARPPGGVVARLHPPRRRTPLVTRLAPGWDWCDMTVPTVRHHGNTTTITLGSGGSATIPLTPAGAAFVDERQVALRVIVMELDLRIVAGLRRRLRRRLSVRRLARFTHAVVLASPLTTPPPGVLGIYSDGRRHHYAARSVCAA